MNKFQQWGSVLDKSLVVASVVMGSISYANISLAQDWNVSDDTEFFNAIEKSRQGDRVILTKDIYSNKFDPVTGKRPINLQGITLDGQNHTLRLVSMPIYLKGNSEIKDINLALIDTKGINFDVNAASLEDGGMPIYANGHDLTLNNVNTRVSGFRNYQPTIYLGGDNKSTVNSDNTLKIINSPDYIKVENPDGTSDGTYNGSVFKKIVAGSQGAEKQGKSTIIVDSNTRIVGNNADQNPPLGKSTFTLKNEGAGFEDKALEVEVINSSRFIAGYDQGTNTNLKLELKDNNMFTPIRTNPDKDIDAITVSGNSNLLVEKPLTVNKLVLETKEGEAPATVNVDISNGKLTVNNLVSTSDNKINTGSSSAITISKIEGEVKLEGNSNKVTMPANYEKDATGVYKPKQEEPAPSPPPAPESAQPEEPPAEAQPDSTTQPQPKPEAGTDLQPQPEEPPHETEAPPTESENHPAETEVPPTPPKEDGATVTPESPPEAQPEGETNPQTQPADAQPQPQPGTGVEEQPHENPAPDTADNQEPPHSEPQVDPASPAEEGTTVTPAPPVEEHPAVPPAVDNNSSETDTSPSKPDTPTTQPDKEATLEPEKEAEISPEERMIAMDKQLRELEDGYFGIYQADIPAQLNSLSNEAMATRSLTAALSTLDAVSYNPAQRTTISAGIGSYGNSKAYAIGLNHFGDFRTAIRGNIAFGASGSKRTMANIGMIWKTGKMNNSPDSFGKTLSRKLAVLDETLNNLEARLQALDEEFAK